jgi:CubicO group peptidase (beta-lactamase class C family)
MKEKLSSLLFVIVSVIGCSDENEGYSEPAEFQWEEITAESAGVDLALINQAFEKGAELGYLYSIIVIRYEKIVGEKYFNGHDRNVPYNIRSVSKSFLSAAFGIAEEEGVISLNDKLTNVVSDYNFSIQDKRFFDITLDDLLKMKSGLDGDKNIYSYFTGSENWLSAILKLQLKNNPGKEFRYSTAGTHLLSAALTKSSGISALQLLNNKLLTPMGIDIDYWETDPQGVYFGGNNMQFTTRNMAVLGLLYMKKGKLNSRQIVPEKWIERSLEDYSGGIGDWGVLSDIGYGYLWWLGTIMNYNTFLAIGHGGQFVLCVPELDLIVATNAHSDIWWEEANKQELEILNIIGNYIIPAMRR